MWSVLKYERDDWVFAQILDLVILDIVFIPRLGAQSVQYHRS